MGKNAQIIEIGLLAAKGGYATDMLVAGCDLSIGTVVVPDLGLPEYHCPYGLPRISSGHTLIISSNWLQQIRQQGIDVISRVLLPLRERFGRIIGLDQSDPFLLCLPDEEVSLMDVVLKVNGIFRDPDLNNYIVGAPTPDGRWSDKSLPRDSTYQPDNLKKLTLSIPCFLGTVSALRAQTRRYYCKSAIRRWARSVGDRLSDELPKSLDPRCPPRSTVHFFASLTHMQRAVTVKKLKRSSLRWKGGLTGIPQYITGFNGSGMAVLSSNERKELKAFLSSENMLTEPLNRINYQRVMADCKVVLSITGYGELCFRMAEAWANRRVLVCQDISNAHTLFPFQEARNVVYCRPDLSDLIEILDDIECNFRKYVDVAEQGYQDWMEWARQPDKILRQGFGHIYNSKYDRQEVG